MPIIITDLVSPTSASDTYATHTSEYGRGGYREVLDVAARDAITVERRQVGMLVFTTTEQKLWQLTDVGLNTYQEVLLLAGEILNPSDGQILRYNSLSSTWENSSPASFSIGDATDIIITNPQAGEALVYSGTEWVNSTQDLANLGDVNFQIALAANQVLTYNGTAWDNVLFPVFSVSNPAAGETLIYNSGTSSWNNGTLPVPSLDALDNTTITTPLDGQYLRYDGNTLRWTNQAADALAIDDLTNVAVLTPQNNEVLTYSGGNWVNLAIPVQNKSMTDLLDVTLSNPASRDILRYNGAAWVNEPLIDFNIVAPAAGQYLRYNSGTLQWENQAADSLAIENLTNVTITTPANGDAIIYNGSIWVNGPPVDPTPPTVGELSDVDYYANPLLPSQVLTYDGVNWTNQDFISINAVDPVDGEVLAYNDQTLEWENRRFESLSSAVVQNGHGFLEGEIIRHNGTSYVLAQADTEANSRVVGIVTTVVDANTFVYTHSGVITNLSGLTAGSAYYLDDATAGAFTATPPASIRQPVFVATSATAAVFFVMVPAAPSVIDGGEIVEPVNTPSLNFAFSTTEGYTPNGNFTF